MEIKNKFDKENSTLIDNIKIISKEDTTSSIIIKYSSENDENYYHNGIVRTFVRKNSKLNIIIINLLNANSNNFLSMENVLGENAELNYLIIDFGGKNSITNYYSNLKR